MAKKVKKTDSYKVGTGNQKVKASVDVGLGQLGFVKMSLDRKPLVSTGAPVGLQTLGSPSELAGKLLIVETVVTDVSIMTNKMSVTHKLIGGPAPKTITVTDEVMEQGDSLLFQASVLFKE
jgi:hypothetical protein